MRPLFTSLSTLLLLSLLVGAPAVDADSPIKVLSQEQSYSFAQQIRFSAEFSATSPFSQVTLLLAPQGDWRVFSAELTIPQEEERVAVSYVLDLQEYPIHPFARVEYWWYVKTANGATMETEPVSFLYADNYYDWHSAQEGKISVYWTADDPSLGHTALRIAQDGLERIQSILPTPLAQEISIYIYPSLDKLGDAMRLADQDWVSGIATPELGVILVTASDTTTAAADLKRTIPHEVAHLVIEQSAGGRNSRVPFWLHEGLASNNTDLPDASLTLALEKAIEEESLFPLETLCAPPLADQSSTQLFYAQSASLVRYLQNLYGNQQLRDLVSAYGDGADCSGGVEREFGISLNELEAEWQAHLREGSEDSDVDVGPPLAGLIIWVGLLGGAAAVAGSFYLFRPRVAEPEADYDRSA